MNKKIYLLPLLSFVFVFFSCEETKEPGKYDNWRERNEAFIDSLQSVFDSKTDPSLFYVVDSRDKSQNIFFKKIKSVNEGTAPVLTSSVKCFYRGMFINEAVFAMAPSPKFYTRQYKQLDVFDQNFAGDDPSAFDSPTVFPVNALINGWIEILQWMKPGERWEIYIPWASAYGSSDRVDTSGNVSVPAYSTLIFDMELLEVTEY